MSTPWSVEFDQNFFIRVNDLIFKCFSNQNFDMTGALNRWLSWFQESWDWSCFNSVNKRVNIVRCDFLSIKEILLTFISQEQNSWCILCVDSQVFRKSIKEPMAIIFVSVSEKKSFRVCLIIGSESLLSSSRLVIISGKEEEGSLLVLENLFDCGIIKGNNLSIYVKCQDDNQDENLVHDCKWI